MHPSPSGRRGQRPGVRETGNLHPLSADLSKGAAYVNLLVRHRDLENLGSLTAGRVRVEAGYLGPGLGVQRRDVVACGAPKSPTTERVLRASTIAKTFGPTLVPPLTFASN